MEICSAGHVTASTDYCDVCGVSMTSIARESTPATCPGCGAPSSGRFCEQCGHDSALAAPASAVTGEPAQWTAIVCADLDYYKRVSARGGPDTVDFPEFFPERRIALRGNTLIGRGNRRQGVEPGIDLGIHPADHGVSTQHAVLRTGDGTLTITDLGSTNGTSLNDSDQLLVNGHEIELTAGDRIHVGAWTTITVAKTEKSRQ